MINENGKPIAEINTQERAVAPITTCYAKTRTLCESQPLLPALAMCTDYVVDKLAIV